MAEGRGALVSARTALLGGDAAAAEERFGDAHAAFSRARDSARNPLLRLAGWIPLLGRTPDAALGLAEGGREVSLAGRALAGGIGGLPRGLSSLAPGAGRLDAASYAALAPALAEARTHLRNADAAVATIERTWLLGPVAEARTQFEAELAPITRGIEAATVIVERFPAFLGQGGVRRYLFAAENPAELRGTGGLVGSVAVMTVRDGRISFGPFEANERFPPLPDSVVEPPNEDYARRYPGAAGFMAIGNLTADFPSAAVALERLYEASRGMRLNGVISADPFALQAMLEVSGDVSVEPLGTISKENVVAMVTNGAYSLVSDGEARSRVLGQVAQTVVSRFLAGAPAEEAATALGRAAADGHLTVHTDDPELQRGLGLAGADGALPDPEGDVLGVIVNNGGANKVDFYAERTLRYQVELGAGGLARSGLEVSIHNGAPVRGQPVYVIGPHASGSRAGENISLLDLYAAPGAELLEAGTEGVGEDTELGYAVFPGSVVIPSGETATIGYQLARPGAWTGSSAQGNYRLTLLGQTTLVPTPARVEIRAPEGTRIVRTSLPMQVEGNRAVWEGVLSSNLTLEIEFQKPFFSRAWDAVTGFFRKRVISF